AQVRSDKRHRIFLGAGEMSEKLSVTRKTITAEKQGALINRSGGDRVDTARRAQLHRRFDITAGGFTSGAGLDPGFDKTADVVEMIDDGFGKLIRKRFSDTNDVVAGLEIECACRVSQQLCVADDHRHANSFDFIFR